MIGADNVVWPKSSMASAVSELVRASVGRQSKTNGGPLSPRRSLLAKKITLVTVSEGSVIAVKVRFVPRGRALSGGNSSRVIEGGLRTEKATVESLVEIDRKSTRLNSSHR